jgi:hypothetical protein
MPEHVCPICGRLQAALFETVDGLACPSCMRYAGARRAEPASWRFNATSGAVGPRREWPGRPPAGAEGAD